MKVVFIFLLAITPWLCKAQTFNFAGKDAVKVPMAITVQVRQYIEKNDGINLRTIGDQYAYVPIFNVLNHSQKQFVDGVYYFTWGAHDSGRLFINQKGKITIFRNGHVSDIIDDYTLYLKQNALPESTRIVYLSAIAAFMKFRNEDQQALIKSGGLQELK